MYWNCEHDFEYNLDNIKRIIQFDIHLNSEQANKLIFLVNKITPNMIKNYSSICLRGDDCSKFIIINNKKDEQIIGTVFIDYKNNHENKVGTNYLLWGSVIGLIGVGIICSYLYNNNFSDKLINSDLDDDHLFVLT